ncbi:MAG: SHOCT domain-containing protein [Dehalococcoidia bacterium]|nr:SHOCT domain-containing protein [Dehalococcoidia bacterium]
MSNGTKTTLIIIGVVILVLILLPSLGGVAMMGGGMMGPGFGGWGGGFGWIWMIIIWVAIIAGVVWAVRAIAGSNDNRPNYQEESAMDIIKKRYARGEIGHEEFEEKKRMLL